MFDLVMYEEFCKAFGHEGGVCQNKDSLLGGFVDDNENGIIRTRFGEGGNKVEGDVLKRRRAGINWM